MPGPTWGTGAPGPTGEPTAPTVPTGGAPALSPSAAVLASSLQSYAVLYADPRRFPPWEDNYNDDVGIVTIAPAGTPTSGAEVLRRVWNTKDSLPQIWMALFADSANPDSMGEVKILHRHVFFAGPMSCPADPNMHDRMYPFLEDFQAGQ
jgi:hypothetical protein